MKNTLLSITLGMVFTYAEAQEIKPGDVPAIVKQAFANKFPGVRKVEWSKESATEFEAEFKSDGIEKSSNFDEGGKWLATETEIKIAQLPTSIQRTIKQEYGGYKMEEAEKIENFSNEISYEVSLEKNEIHLEITFSSDGKVIRKEEKKEDKR